MSSCLSDIFCARWLVFAQDGQSIIYCILCTLCPAQYDVLRPCVLRGKAMLHHCTQPVHLHMCMLGLHLALAHDLPMHTHVVEQRSTLKSSYDRSFYDNLQNLQIHGLTSVFQLGSGAPVRAPPVVEGVRLKLRGSHPRCSGCDAVKKPRRTDVPATSPLVSDAGTLIQLTEPSRTDVPAMPQLVSDASTLPSTVAVASKKFSNLRQPNLLHNAN